MGGAQHTSPFSWHESSAYRNIGAMGQCWILMLLVWNRECKRRQKSFSEQNLMTNYGLSMVSLVTFKCISHTCSWIWLNNVQPFTFNFNRADIYELLTPDLLHQAIKGTFKDHLVLWVQEYLEKWHGPSESKHMLDKIDRRCVFLIKGRATSYNLLYNRISLVPPFSGL